MSLPEAQPLTSVHGQPMTKVFTSAWHHGSILDALAAHFAKPPHLSAHSDQSAFSVSSLRMAQGMDGRRRGVLTQLLYENSTSATAASQLLLQPSRRLSLSDVVRICLSVRLVCPCVQFGKNYAALSNARYGQPPEAIVAENTVSAAGRKQLQLT